MNKAEQIGKVIRSVLIEYGNVQENRVAVALSGGVDSCAVLAGMVHCGVKPVVLSYTPATHASTDFQMAKSTARNLNLEFIPVIVDVQFDNMNQLARTVIALGFHSKVQVESLAPMVEISRSAADAHVDFLLTGDQSDGYFALSKWAAHNYDRHIGVPKGSRSRTVKSDKTSERIDAIRARYYRDDLSCSEAVRIICASVGVSALFPFRREEIRDAFVGSLWSEINQPRIKEPVRLAFPEYFTRERIWVRPTQVNLHKGDSFFGDTMTTVMMNGHPSFVTARGLYSAIARGEA